MAGYQELTIGRLVDILVFHSIQDAMWRLLRYKCNRCDIWNLAIVLFFSRGGSRKAHRDPLTTGASSDRNAVLAGIGKTPTHGAMNVYFSHPIRQNEQNFVDQYEGLKVKSCLRIYEWVKIYSNCLHCRNCMNHWDSDARSTKDTGSIVWKKLLNSIKDYYEWNKRTAISKVVSFISSQGETES